MKYHWPFKHFILILIKTVNNLVTEISQKILLISFFFELKISNLLTRYATYLIIPVISESNFNFFVSGWVVGEGWECEKKTHFIFEFRQLTF